MNILTLRPTLAGKVRVRVRVTRYMPQCKIVLVQCQHCNNYPIPLLLLLLLLSVTAAADSTTDAATAVIATCDTAVCWLVGCLTSQQHASVSQGRICSDNFMCCHTETEVADPTFHLTQSQYTDTGPTSPSTDPIMPDTWQGSHWSANF